MYLNRPSQITVPAAASAGRKGVSRDFLSIFDERTVRLWGGRERETYIPSCRSISVQGTPCSCPLSPALQKTQNPIRNRDIDSRTSGLGTYYYLAASLGENSIK